MLERVLEPEVMDTPDEARDYDSMDHSEVNQLFVADFLASWDGQGPILDAGTGTAQIPIELCRRKPGTAIVAFDLAAEMLALAKRNVGAAGLNDSIRLERADAKRLDHAAGSFAAVISNSIIHHIPEPLTCFAELNRVCRPGGRIFLRDLLRPDDLESLRRLVNTYAAHANEHQRKMFGDSLHAALALHEVRDMIGRLGYSPEAVQQTSDRHWTFSTTRP